MPATEATFEVATKAYDAEIAAIAAPHSERMDLEASVNKVTRQQFELPVSRKYRPPKKRDELR